MVDLVQPQKHCPVQIALPGSLGKLSTELKPECVSLTLQVNRKGENVQATATGGDVPEKPAMPTHGEEASEKQAVANGGDEVAQEQQAAASSGGSCAQEQWAHASGYSDSQEQWVELSGKDDFPLK